jgi:hypothetical protein
MNFKNALGSLALAATLAGVSGCVVRAHGQVSAPVAVVEVDEEPPPPRAMVIETRPGFVFIEGRWARNGGRWVWRDGYYERERVGYAWDQGRWEMRGNRHVWVEGRWRGGAAPGPAVRDHREERREERREEHGPVVRDHR